jgi:hypothetical protein
LGGKQEGRASMRDLTRRGVIELVGGAAAWPLGAGAQQPARMRRVGALSGIGADDPESQARIAAFEEVLRQLGWTDGRNVRIEHRWGGGDPDNIRKQAAELAALTPDVILATGVGSAWIYCLDCLSRECAEAVMQPRCYSIILSAHRGFVIIAFGHTLSG